MSLRLSAWRFVLDVMAPFSLPVLASPLASGFFLTCFGRWVTSPRWLWRLPVQLGPLRLQRPSIRAGSNARHPMLSASFDQNGQACRRRPHLYDGLLGRPGQTTGHLHQHQDQSLTPHLNTAYASLLTPLEGRPPQVQLPSSGSAKAPQATYAPSPPCRCVSYAYHRHHSAP
jgi:hypothetical protein